MDKKVIGIMVGSLRRGSFSKKVAVYLSGLLEDRFELKFFDIGSLTIYNQDLDNDSDAPQEWLRLREHVKSADAVLFVTPEYNRSMPPVLKNAIDIASRPPNASGWRGKPGAVISISPGSIGGFGASHHLRQSAACLDIYMMPNPEVYIGGIADLVDSGGVSDKGTKDYLKKFTDAFADWISKFVN